MGAALLSRGGTRMLMMLSEMTACVRPACRKRTSCIGALGLLHQFCFSLQPNSTQLACTGTLAACRLPAWCDLSNSKASADAGSMHDHSNSGYSTDGAEAYFSKSPSC